MNLQVWYLILLKTNKGIADIDSIHTNVGDKTEIYTLLKCIFMHSTQKHQYNYSSDF